MKKIIFSLIFLLIFSGCTNDALNGYTTVTCTKEQTFNETKNTNKVEIRQKDNNVIDLTIHQLYETSSSSTLDAYKQSLIAQSNEYKDKNIEIASNQLSSSFEMIYKIKKENFTDEIIEKFKIEELASNQIRNYEKLGYSCK